VHYETDGCGKSPPSRAGTRPTNGGPPTGLGNLNRPGDFAKPVLDSVYCLPRKRGVLLISACEVFSDPSASSCCSLGLSFTSVGT